MSVAPRAPVRAPRPPLPERRFRTGERRGSSGQSVVEFALGLPIFLLFLLMAVDFGRLFYTYVQVSNAAREAAIYGATQPSDDSGMQVRAVQEKSSQTQGEAPLEPLATDQLAAVEAI